MKTFIQIILLNLFFYACADPIVQTTFGLLRGSTVQSRLGKTIYSFRGVRFAKPPLGPLRFLPPQNLEPWDGVVNATEDGPACPQVVTEAPTDEDCLFLNVYSTNLNIANKPVFIYFHPGAWLFFNGRSDFFGPQYLLDHDVVLVTTNYRLGTLGFLSTGDDELPGNQGLKDQVAVMRWVQSNIAFFGGDPNKVTIGGYSAGAYSVSLHLVSPMSKGLFKQAIAMSGSGILPSASMRKPREIFWRQAEYLNCSISNSTQEVLECLRSKTPEEIIESSRRFIIWNGSPLVFISFMVEKPRKNGGERFLIEEPIKSFASGRFDKNIPLMIGHTLHEFDYVGPILALNQSALNDLNQNGTYLFSLLIAQQDDPENNEVYVNRLKEFYFNNEPLTEESATALGYMTSDIAINFPAYRTAKLVADKSKAPIYFYHFTYQGRYSWFYRPDNTTPYGVVHHDDMMYLFYMSRFPFFEKNDPEIKMVETYTRLFSNFLKTGNPNEKHETIWVPLTKRNPKYLEIGNDTLKMHNGWINARRMQFWDETYPIPSVRKNYQHY